MTSITPTVKRVVPGPPGHPLLGHLGEIRRDGMQFERSAARTYGDVVRLRFAERRAFLISNPADIHKVLVQDADKFQKAPIYRVLLTRFLGNGLLTSEGDFWKRQRKLSQPAFHTKRVQTYAETMVDTTEALLAGWTDGEVREINRDMMRLTLTIVVKALFNTEIGLEADRLGQALTTVLDATTDGLQSVFQMLPEWVPLPRNIRNRRGVRQLDAIINRIISQRRESGEDTGDLLSMLLMARDDDGHQMTDKQLRDEVVTLVLAGHETTANALTWTFYLLSQHPDVEAKLHAELETVLGGRAPAFADLRQLVYTNMVIKEAMRLYPPIPSIGRQALQPVELGGYALPAGAIFIISPHVVHRDPRWWAEPDAFRPERFAKENEKAIEKFAYLPFGGGPRVCIGNSFAEMESVLVLATIAQRYRLRLDPADQPVIPEPTLTLRPRHPLTLRVEPRQPIAQAPESRAVPA